MARPGSVQHTAVCRPATADEVDICLRLWQNLSWEPDELYPAALQRASRYSGFRVVCIPNDQSRDIGVVGAAVPTAQATSSCADSAKEQRAVGCILAWVYVDIGFIGYFSLLEEYRSLGLGQLLLQDAIDYLRNQGCTSIGLDAVPAAFKLYHKFGFKPSGKRITWFYLDIDGLQESSSPQLESHDTVTANKLEIVNPLNEAIVDQFVALDTDITGFQRAGAIRELLKTTGWHLFSLNPGFGSAADKGEAVRTAFAATRPIPNGHAIGPLYADTYEDAAALLEQVTIWHRKRQTQSDVPSEGKMQFAIEAWSENHETYRLFCEKGWREDSHYYNRMWLGHEPEGQIKPESRIYTVLDSGLG